MDREPAVRVDSWATASDPEWRSDELEGEKRVSRVIREMPFLWIEVDDLPGPESDRAYVARNAIALLSNFRKFVLDAPSRE